MGHYSFLRDLEESKIAVELVKTYIIDEHKKEGVVAEIEELGRARQIEGDIEVTLPDRKYTIEIKYDIMAQKTNNLCFETNNKKGKLTGISSTQSHKVIYVVPDKKNFYLYLFETEKLQKYLLDDDNKSRFRSVWGGDRWSTEMTLVPRETIIKEKINYKVEYINAGI